MTGTESFSYSKSGFNHIKIPSMLNQINYICFAIACWIVTGPINPDSKSGEVFK